MYSSVLRSLTSLYFMIDSCVSLSCTARALHCASEFDLLNLSLMAVDCRFKPAFSISFHLADVTSEITVCFSKCFLFAS